ncbi:hypothetical protein F5X98DRAFT_55257 [Xylaria grammica]|nr:hypothetical protein F5X98DRAFT_55257 [Xylaria grammica]
MVYRRCSSLEWFCFTYPSLLRRLARLSSQTQSSWDSHLLMMRFCHSGDILGHDRTWYRRYRRMSAQPGFPLRDISWEKATPTARSLLHTRHWGLSYRQHDKHPTTPNRMYDVESGKVRSGSIRASFSHHVRRQVSHDPMPAESANIAHPSHVRLMRSYDTNIGGTRDFVV